MCLSARVHCHNLVLLIVLLCQTQVCLQMESLHPDSFNPQLPPGYTSAAAVFNRWVGEGVWGFIPSIHILCTCCFVVVVAIAL